MESNVVYALDFDGVLCDSAVETGVAGWKAAIQLWADMPATDIPPRAMTDQFRQFRPQLETGYETIIFMRLLHEGMALESLMANFEHEKQLFLTRYNLDPDDLKQLFGQTRDHWINQDEQQWVNLNPLFSGVAEKLKRLENQSPWYIVTTKQERFVKQILEANQITLPVERIFGLDRNASKETILTELLQTHQHTQLFFVEDRLPTLLKVANNPQLKSIKLMLASWGYNTALERQGLDSCAIELVDLEAFLV
jgi:phosphoglycolate phosphatase-like HAD superfamily hydrolase